MVPAVFTVKLKGVGTETNGNIMHCQLQNAQYDVVLKFRDKDWEHFCIVLDGRGEAGNVGDVHRGDRTTMNYINLVGGSEA